jgi:aspartate 1-decarboxylase
MSYTEATLEEGKSWKPQVIVLGHNNGIVNEHGV